MRKNLITVDQAGSILQVLQRFPIDKEKGIFAPLYPGLSLFKTIGKIRIVVLAELSMPQELTLVCNYSPEEKPNQGHCQEIVGSLLYAVLAPPPDIWFAVGVLRGYAPNPVQCHMLMARGVMRY